MEPPEDVQFAYEQRATVASTLDDSLDVALGGTFEESLHAIARLSRLLLAAHQCSISYSPSGDFTRAIQAHSFSEKYKKYDSHDLMPTARGIWALIAERKIPIRMTHRRLKSHPRWKNFRERLGARGLEHPPMRGWLAAPVSRLNGEVAGVLQVADRFDGDFSDEDQCNLRHFARVAGMAFDLYWANNELRTQVEKEVEERALMDDQLRHSQKLKAAGELGSGLAHNLNNLLTVVSGISELALEKLDPDDPLRGDLEMVHRAGEKAVDLTRQLQAFSRPQVVRPRVLDLNALLSEFEKLLRHTTVEDVEIVTVLDPALGRLRADPGQLEQVLLNLVINARDAMPDGGKLTVETANVELHEALTHEPLVLPPGSYVMLAVTDTGVGMDEETRNRIFEPFFTTKAKNEGTGLGLATAYGIVKQNGGDICAYSEPGKGTTFRIYFPRVEEAAAGARREATASSWPSIPTSPVDLPGARGPR